MAVGASAQSPSTKGKVGEAAPPLSVKGWIGKSWPGFAKGRVTVLEFWAPWCSPCVAAFPHLNALVDEMKDDPVDFVSITDEPEAKVKAFLEKRPLRTLTALDKSGETFAKYGASVIPHTVVIGPDGKVMAVTRPGDLTAAALREAIAGRDPKLPKKVSVPGDLEWDVKAGLNPAEALSLAAMIPSPATSGSYKPDKETGRFIADGVSLMNMIKVAYGADLDVARGDVPKTSPLLRISIKAPDGKYETALAMLRQLIKDSFGLSAQWEEVERKVWVLRRTSEPMGLAAAKPGTPGGEARAGAIHGKGQKSEYLATMAGLFGYGKKAIDETGLTGIYDIDLEWIPGDAESFNAGLAKLGFEMIEAPRKVRELVISGG